MVHFNTFTLQKRKLKNRDNKDLRSRIAENIGLGSRQTWVYQLAAVNLGK